jgi:hypothetical protein
MEEEIMGDDTTTTAICVMLEFAGENLEFRHLATFRLVCRMWRDVVDGAGFSRSMRDVVGVPARCMLEIDGALKKLNGRNIEHQSHQIGSWESNRQRKLGFPCHENDMRRLDMLVETLKLAKSIFDDDTKWPPRLGRRLSSLQMMHRISRQFRGTAKLMDEIATKKCSITHNFDLIEMGLRRRLEEIETATDPPSDCIREMDARYKWESMFGGRQWQQVQIDWKNFKDKFVNMETMQVCDTMERQHACMEHLRAYLCFPEENVVTPYSIHLLSSTCGPTMGEVWTNFVKLMTEDGFVGMMNMVFAESLLLNVHWMQKKELPTYLLRYSRNNPDVFTVTTYDPRNKKMLHKRNMNPTLTLSHLHRKMRDLGYQPAKFRIDATTSSALEMSKMEKCRYLCFY